MREYEALKDIFENFPAEYKEERKALFKHTAKAYRIIKKRTETLKTTGKKRKKPKASNNKELSNLKGNLKEIIRLLKENRTSDAQLKLLDVKRTMHAFPADKKVEKERIEKLIDEIDHRINSLKRGIV